MAGPSKSTEDRSVEVAFVCANDGEAAPIVKRLGGRRKTTGHEFVLVEGVLARRKVVVVTVATQQKSVAGGVDALESVHHPRWIIAAGFAVGLRESLRTGDIVMASELVNEAGERLVIDLRSPRDGPSRGVHTGRLVSVTKWPRSPASKFELADRTDAIAADLQSFALARACAERGTKFIAVRVVADAVGTKLAPGTLAALRPSRVFRAGAIVGAFMSGSGRVGKLWKQQSAAKGYAERLAAFLAELLPQLP